MEYYTNNTSVNSEIHIINPKDVYKTKLVYIFKNNLREVNSKCISIRLFRINLNLIYYR